MTEVRLLVQFNAFRDQNWIFEVISRWLCMVLRRGVYKHNFPSRSLKIKPKKQQIRPTIKQIYKQPKKCKFSEGGYRPPPTARRPPPTAADRRRPSADRRRTARTCPISDFWSNFACFVFKIRFLKKFLDDSAWFCLEKLKKTRLWNKALQMGKKN